MQKGKFIVFEGLDGSGKSTQCQLLHEKLGGLLIRFPDRTTEIGLILDSYLKKKIDLNAHTVATLFSANRWENMKKITEALNAGQTVIADRYTYSGLAYAPENLRKYIAESDRGLPEPDTVFFIMLGPTKCMERSNTEKLETLEMQKKAYSEFALMSGGWIIINGNKSIENIHAEILKFIN